MFDLEFLVDIENVLVQRLREQVIDFLSQVYLSHLKFGQVVGCVGIFVIGLHHLGQD